jgi:uncharacterized protein YcbK (DUF882 family)
MQLSEHFTLKELTASDTAARLGIDNTPPVYVVENLKRLCALLEDVRHAVGKPIRISSGYRCHKVNHAVGSRDTSQHLQGCAADIKAQGVTVDELMKAIIGAGVKFDQLIREFDSWVHISIPNTPADKPRHSMLIIDHAGTRPYEG